MLELETTTYLSQFLNICISCLKFIYAVLVTVTLPSSTLPVTSPSARPTSHDLGLLTLTHSREPLALPRLPFSPLFTRSMQLPLPGTCSDGHESTLPKPGNSAGYTQQLHLRSLARDFH